MKYDCRLNNGTIFLLIFSTIFIMIKLVSTKYIVGINVSNSLPYRLFIIHKSLSYKKKSFIAFHLNNYHLYKPNSIFIKRIEGVSGDRVKIRKHMIFINGKTAGRILLTNHQGRTLHQGLTGVIPEGYYYVATDNPRSYDSRYLGVGWIARSQIIGEAYPLW